MWRLAAQYRSPGYSGNLASLQCQLGCLLPQGKHLLTHTVAWCFTYRRRGSWPACSGLTTSHKCIMNLTNITSLYGYPCTCCFPSNCNQNTHMGCSLEIPCSIPYASEGTLLPQSSFQRTFRKIQYFNTKIYCVYWFIWLCLLVSKIISFCLAF